eukprot:6011903-Prymnesium_polylepis.1
MSCLSSAGICAPGHSPTSVMKRSVCRPARFSGCWKWLQKLVATGVAKSVRTSPAMQIATRLAASSPPMPDCNTNGVESDGACLAELLARHATDGPASWRSVPLQTCVSRGPACPPMRCQRRDERPAACAAASSVAPAAGSRLGAFGSAHARRRTRVLNNPTLRNSVPQTPRAGVHRRSRRRSHTTHTHTLRRGRHPWRWRSRRRQRRQRGRPSSGGPRAAFARPQARFSPACHVAPVSACSDFLPTNDSVGTLRPFSSPTPSPPPPLRIGAWGVAFGVASPRVVSATCSSRTDGRGPRRDVHRTGRGSCEPRGCKY